MSFFGNRHVLHVVYAGFFDKSHVWYTTCLDDSRVFLVGVYESIRFLLVRVFMISQVLVKVPFWHDTMILGVYISLVA